MGWVGQTPRLQPPRHRPVSSANSLCDALGGLGGVAAELELVGAVQWLVSTPRSSRS